MKAAVTWAPSRQAQLDALRRHIARLERAGVVESAFAPPPLRFGAVAVDDVLPTGGLAGGRLHELRDGEITRVPDGKAPVTAVTAGLIARAVRESGKAAAWIGNEETLFLPGLAGFGLSPQDLIVVTPKDDAGTLWAAEECLRGGQLCCVVTEVRDLSLVASRRLQLAAEVGGCTGLLLRGDAVKKHQLPPPSACVTSWQITPLPGGASVKSTLMGPARWRLDLQRCRGGVPQAWDVEWSHDTGGFTVAAPVRDRPVVPAPGVPGVPAVSLARAG